MEFPFGKNNQNPLKKSPKIALLITIITLLLLAITPLYYPSLGFYPNILLSKKPSPPSSGSFSLAQEEEDIRQIITTTTAEDIKNDDDDDDGKYCDIFSGEWVPNQNAPYYTNKTCWAIHEHQNCMKYGRPDSDFMKWRWKPDGCELPIFNPFQFLDIVRGKSLAFVGDSVGRNQMQSLICLLSRVEYPVDVSYTLDENFKRLIYKSYNFTLANFWTPHLVKGKEAASSGPTNTGLFNLYLDEFDESWTTQVEGFDYLIISAGHWFFRPMVYYENREIIGCRYCLLDNVTDMPMYYGYRKAFKNAFRAINSLKRFKGTTFLRTFSPSHFENGAWNEGGNCVRKRPFRSNETSLEGASLEFYMIQMEEFKIAEKEGKKRGLKHRLLDTTQAMLLRPDGHPSRYGHWPNENVTLYNDCVHWCLPGPIDTWNDFLLEMLKIEGVRSYEDKLYAEDRKMKL